MGERGNSEFKNSDFHSAIASYAKAIQLLDLEADDQGDEVLNKWSDSARREARDKLGLACFLNSAQCQLKLELFDAASRSCNVALVLDPRSGKAIYRRGLAAMGLGYLESARTDLTEAVRREPQIAEVRAQLQLCTQKLNSSVQKERSTFSGLFGKASLYDDAVKAMPVEALPRVFLQFEVEEGGQPLVQSGRLEVALYVSDVPEAAAVLRHWCASTGDSATSSCSDGGSNCLHGVYVHRMVKDFVLQVGPMRPPGSALQREVGRRRHDRRGLVSMASSSSRETTPHFSVLLGPAPQLDPMQIVVGEVIIGLDVLAALESLAVDSNERPLHPCRVESCGLVQDFAGGKSEV